MEAKQQGQWRQGSFCALSVNDAMIEAGIRASGYVPDVHSIAFDLARRKEEERNYYMSNEDWVQAIPRNSFPDRMVWAQAASSSLDDVTNLWCAMTEAGHEPIEWRLSRVTYHTLRKDDNDRRFASLHRGEISGGDLSYFQGLPFCKSHDAAVLLLAYRGLERVRDLQKEEVVMTSLRTAEKLEL